MRTALRAPEAMRLLRMPLFGRFLAALTISTLGTGIATVALAFAVLGFGGATELASILLAREIPTVLFVLLGGVAGDRFARRNILVASDIVRGLAQSATALLLVTNSATVISIGALQMVVGTALAFSRPAATGLVKEVVDAPQLQSANAFVGLTRSSLSIAGPAAGALLVAATGPAIAIAFDAGTFFISAILLASLPLSTATRRAATSLISELRHGWREFVARPWAVAMVASFGVFQLAFFPAFFVLGPLTAQRSYGGAAGWGMILSAIAAGAVAGGLVGFRFKPSKPLVAAEALLLPAAALLGAVAISAPLAVVVGLGALEGAAFAVSDVLWTTSLQRLVPAEALSRISAFDWIGSLALNPLGYAIVAPLSLSFGYPNTLGMAAGLCCVVSLAVVCLPSVRRVQASTLA
ncbi:MAG: MFS transporter [Chloroflexi bacterium]|nr:MFS transporter [Chloroflexota bacterium]